MMTRRFVISASALVAAAVSSRALRAVADGAERPSFPVGLDDADWRGRLTPERFAVLRRGGDEPRFSSGLVGERRRGAYACAGCGQDAFSSAAKFDGGSGWPSFWAPFYGAVVEIEDRSAAVFRADVRCSRCGGHLGSLSRDAPTPTSLSYRVDGVALDFKPRDA